MGMADRPQLAEEVAAELRGRIMSGDLRPGTRIRLEEVAGRGEHHARAGSTLTLRGKDMVELEPRKGHVVAPLSRQDVLDLFQIQGDIAGGLAARVAARISEPVLEELSQADQALAKARRPDEIEKREYEFHRLVNKLADSRKLSWFLHTATRYTPARFYSADPAWRDGTRTAHTELLAALAARDADTARAVMTRHFTDGADRLVKHLDELGIWSDADGTGGER
jgi:DNA-binding GntR family transcriptional regulator